MNDNKMIDYYQFSQETYLNQTSDAPGECAGYALYAMILLAKGRNLTSWFRKKFNNANNSFAIVNYLQTSYLNRVEHNQYYDFTTQLDDNINFRSILPFHDEIPEAITNQQLESPAVDLFDISISSYNKAHAMMAYSQIINGEMVYGFFDPNHCVIIFNDKDLLYDYIKNHIVKYYSDYTEIASTQMNPLISPIDSSIRLKYSESDYKLIREKFANTIINTMSNAKKAKDNRIKVEVEFQDYLQYELSFNRELKKALKPDTIITQENIDNICLYIYEFANAYNKKEIDSYGFDKFVYPKILGVRNNSYSNFAEFLNSLEKINPNLKINIEKFRESIIRQKIDNATNAETLEEACIFVGILDGSSSFDETIINDNKYRENIDTINNKKILNDYNIISCNDINELITYWSKNHNDENNYAFIYQLRKLHFEGQRINITLESLRQYYSNNIIDKNTNALIRVNLLMQELTVKILESSNLLLKIMKRYGINIIDILNVFHPTIIINNNNGITEEILQLAIIKHINQDMKYRSDRDYHDSVISAMTSIIKLYTPLMTSEEQCSNIKDMTERLIEISVVKNRIDILERFDRDIIGPIIRSICKSNYFNMPLNVVKYLIQRRIFNLYDDTLLRSAISYNREDVMKYLIDTMDVSIFTSEHLVSICHSNSFEIAQLLIDKKPQLIDTNIGSKIFSQQSHIEQLPNFLEIIKFLESKQKPDNLVDFYINTIKAIYRRNGSTDTLDTLNYLKNQFLPYRTSVWQKLYGEDFTEFCKEIKDKIDFFTKEISEILAKETDSTEKDILLKILSDLRDLDNKAVKNPEIMYGVLMDQVIYGKESYMEIMEFFREIMDEELDGFKKLIEEKKMITEESINRKEYGESTELMIDEFNEYLNQPNDSRTRNIDIKENSLNPSPSQNVLHNHNIDLGLQIKRN